MTALMAILGAAFTVASCWASGRAMARRESSEVLRFVLGAAVFSGAVFLLAIFRLANFWTLGALGLAAFAAARRLPRFSWVRAAWVLVPFAVFYFVYALAPEGSPDGSGYHLGLVRRYWEHGGIVRILTSIYASFPQAAEMLFLPAFAIGGHSSAALVHLSFLFAAAWLLIHFDASGWLAALLVVSSPVAGITASSAYVDAALACALFALFVLLERESPNPWLAGLLAGFAMAIKYTGGVGLVYALWRCRKPPVLAAALLTVSPWLVKNAVFTGNPLAPAANALFPNALFDATQERGFAAAMRDYNGAVATPLEIAVRGEKLQGILGPAFLFAPAALLAWPDPRGRRLLAATLLFSAGWLANHGTRFLIPALPPLACAMAIGLSRWRPAMALVAVVAFVCAWPAAITRYSSPYVWHIGEFPWRAALGIEPAESYLRRKLGPTYDIARMLDRAVPPGCPVYTAFSIPDAYTSREVRLDYASLSNIRLSEALARGDLQAFRNEGTPWILLHRDEPAASKPLPGASLHAESGPGLLYRMDGKCFGSY